MNNKTKVLAGLLASLLSACASLTPANSNRPSGPSITMQVPGDGQAVAPAKPRSDLDSIARIVVPVSVNEQGPFQFLFDTGATHVVLSQQLLEQLRLSANPDLRMRIRGISGVSTVPTVDVFSVSMSGLQLGTLRAPVLAGPVMERIDGILGMQGLSDKKVLADLVSQRVQIVAADGQRADARYAVVPFAMLAHRFISVDARVAQVRVKAVIDTGGTQTLGNLALLNALIKRSRGQSLQGLRSGLVDTSAISIPTVLMPVSSLQLGNVEFSQLPVSFGDFSVFQYWNLQNQPALVLAMDALGLLQEINIDYRRQELQFLGRSAP